MELPKRASAHVTYIVLVWSRGSTAMSVKLSPTRIMAPVLGSVTSATEEVATVSGSDQFVAPIARTNQGDAILPRVSRARVEGQLVEYIDQLAVRHDDNLVCGSLHTDWGFVDGSRLAPVFATIHGTTEK